VKATALGARAEPSISGPALAGIGAEELPGTALPRPARARAALAGALVALLVCAIAIATGLWIASAVFHTAPGSIATPVGSLAS
jgi:hypothetical protein